MYLNQGWLTKVMGFFFCLDFELFSLVTLHILRGWLRFGLWKE